MMIHNSFFMVSDILLPFLKAHLFLFLYYIKFHSISQYFRTVSVDFPPLVPHPDSGYNKLLFLSAFSGR